MRPGWMPEPSPRLTDPTPSRCWTDDGSYSPTLPADSYAASKSALISDFERIMASGETVRNSGLKPQLNGFDVRGQDRTVRQGGVLGIYLLFEDQTHTVLTIYFLNQEKPHFKDMAEYAALRDSFLNRYTGCLRVAEKAAATR